MYYLLRGIGRLSFPVVCFLLVQGVKYTHSKGRYLGRMLFWAFLSEVPYDMAFAGSGSIWKQQNVLFTLAIGMGVLWALQWCEKVEYGGWLRILVILLGMAAAGLLRTDYSGWGILLILVMAWGETRRREMVCDVVVLCLWRGWMELAGALALLPILRYTPEDGGTGLPAVFFYGFYPGHLLVLVFLRWILG